MGGEGSRFPLQRDALGSGRGRRAEAGSPVRRLRGSLGEGRI